MSIDKRKFGGDGGIEVPQISALTGDFNYALAATSNNALYTVAVDVDALVNGANITFKMPNAASSGSVTMNVNSLGAKKAYLGSDQTIQAGAYDLQANAVYEARYDTSLDTGTGGWVIEEAVERVPLINKTTLATSNNIAYTSTLPVKAYASGLIVTLTMPAANSGASCTLNINSLGAKKLMRANGTTQITTDDLTASQTYIAVYDAALDTASGAFVVIGVVGAGDITATEIADGAVLATKLQAAAADLGDADVDIDLSNTNSGNVTNMTIDGTMTALAFVGDVVNTSGAQEVAGVKTFTSIPVLPASDPTTGNQAARKTYVDSLASNAASSAVMIFVDDFMEGAAALASTKFSSGHWTGAGTSGTQAIVAGSGGIMELSTTATGSRTSTMTLTSAHLDIAEAPIFECRAKLSNITNTKMEIGLYVDANDCCLFRFDTAVDAGNIYLISEKNNGGEVSTDTTVDLTAGDYFTFRIELSAAGVIAAKINGNTVAAAHAGDVRAVAFKPWFYVDNKAAAEEKLLDIDYVKIIQNRDA